MGSLPRLHLVELEECAWVPRFLREGVIEALGFIMRLTGAYRLIAFPPLRRWLQGRRRLLDLASGSGMPMEDFVRWRQAQGDTSELSIVLSDLQPNLASFERLAALHPGVVEYIDRPVDALCPPAEVARLPRVMIGAFHHLRPEQARAMLADAAARADALFIFEPLTRRPLSILSNLTGLFAGMVAPFFADRLDPLRILFSTVLPVIPLMLAFDGVVSALRCYSVAEIEQMIRALPDTGFTWEVFEVGGPYPPTNLMRTMFITGVRRAEAASG